MSKTPKTDAIFAKHSYWVDDLRNALRDLARELERENNRLVLALDVAMRDAGLYAATLTLTARHLGCDEHMVDHEVKRLLPKKGE